MLNLIDLLGEQADLELIRRHESTLAHRQHGHARGLIEALQFFEPAEVTATFARLEYADLPVREGSDEDATPLLMCLRQVLTELMHKSPGKEK